MASMLYARVPASAGGWGDEWELASSACAGPRIA